MFTHYQETVRCTPVARGETLFITVGRGMGTTYALLSRAANNNVIRPCPQGSWRSTLDKCRNLTPVSVHRTGCDFGKTRLTLVSSVTPDTLRGFGEIHLDACASEHYFDVKQWFPSASIIVATDPESFIRSYAPKLKGVYRLLTWPWDISPYLEEANPRYKRAVIDQQLTGEWK